MVEAGANCTVVDQLHGPEFVGSFDDTPAFLIVFWFIGSIFFVIQTRIYFKHNNKLKAVDPRTRLCRQYQWIIVLPQVFSASSLFALFLPRAYPLFEFVRIAAEAFCLMAFQQSLMIIMAAQGGKGKGYGPLGDYNAQSLAALKALPPTRIWSVPPLGCFFRRCEKPRTLTKLSVRIANSLVLQFMYAGPLLSFCNVLVLLNADGRYELELSVISGAIISSMLTAVYGLFVMYAATHHVLGEDFSTSAKFAAVKALVILEKATAWTLKLLGQLFGVYFLKNVTMSAAYDKEARRNILVSFLTVFESLFLMILMTRAFPAADLVVAHSLRMAGVGRHYFLRALGHSKSRPELFGKLKRSNSDSDIRVLSRSKQERKDNLSGLDNEEHSFVGSGSFSPVSNPVSAAPSAEMLAKPLIMRRKAIDEARDSGMELDVFSSITSVHSMQEGIPGSSVHTIQEVQLEMPTTSRTPGKTSP
eukprot:gb/GEZN01006103.1/.p1 GENE.gb/GEZN01006103.1/~~gb/GEZN01006103.1/.p1  ORF type:complete len:474 (-),score=61.66 gb/GEZN01006103.1/:210-1631(-)